MNLLVFLTIGTLAMLAPVMIQSTWYKVNWKKSLLITVMLTATGTLGTFLMYFVENGSFGGISFYGAVFFVPILFVIVARLVGVRYGVLMDLCAPAECVMLAIMKVQCLLTGCCGGVLLRYNGVSYVFPSQIMEMVNGLVIGVILLLMARKEKNRGRLFPWYMVIYGVTRFVLNMFRQGGAARILGLPFGNFWSLVSIVVGIIWLWIARKRNMKESSLGLDE